MFDLWVNTSTLDVVSCWHVPYLSRKDESHTCPVCCCTGESIIQCSATSVLFNYRDSCISWQQHVIVLLCQADADTCEWVFCATVSGRHWHVWVVDIWSQVCSSRSVQCCSHIIGRLSTAVPPVSHLHSYLTRLCYLKMNDSLFGSEVIVMYIWTFFKRSVTQKMCMVSCKMWEMYKVLVVLFYLLHCECTCWSKSQMYVQTL